MLGSCVLSLLLSPLLLLCGCFSGLASANTAALLVREAPAEASPLSSLRNASSPRIAFLRVRRSSPSFFPPFPFFPHPSDRSSPREGEGRGSSRGTSKGNAPVREACLLRAAPHSLPSTSLSSAGLLTGLVSFSPISSCSPSSSRGSPVRLFPLTCRGKTTEENGTREDRQSKGDRAEESKGFWKSSLDRFQTQREGAQEAAAPRSNQERRQRQIEGEAAARTAEAEVPKKAAKMESRADEPECEKAEVAAARERANFNPEEIGQDLTLTFLRVPEKQINDVLKRIKKFLFHRRNFKSVRDEDFQAPCASDNALLEESATLHETAGKEEPSADACKEEGADARAGDWPIKEGECEETPAEAPETKNQPKRWKRILLSEEVQEDLSQLPSSVREWLLAQNGFAVGRELVHLSYAHLTAEEAMQKLVPAGLEMPRRYETIGHIAHLNLRDHLLPYRFLIARLLLDKQLGLKTVVNKTGIASQWRELQFEHLGGEPRFIARLKENDMQFEINYERVYWNSRLAAEREKITAEVPRSSIVLDCFAGVGAFSLFLAQRRNCLVLANDFNPNAVICMKKNRSLNKVSEATLRAFNLDARAFVRRAAGSPEKLARLVRLRRHMEESCTQKKRAENQKGENGKANPESEGEGTTTKRRKTEAETSEAATDARGDEAADGAEGGSRQRSPKHPEETAAQIECHYLMNLPELAIAFLDVFPGLLARSAASSEGSRGPGGDSPEKEGEQGDAFTHSDTTPLTAEEVRDTERLRHRVHCYAFSRSNPPEIELRPRVEQSLGFWPADVHVREVRDVAPNKRMFCLTFDVPLRVLSASSCS
uniref:tRNA (guanine(37)-N1)-methyltransferase n=1 Tax=Neospora caninum (strain Liverpool) TaxID=572307 RepID=A0A0F7UBH6_NEOCL|nr:TPA: Met-10 like-protein [Neospora caninum Liverpool]